MLALVFGFNTIRLWDPITGSLRTILDALSGVVRAVAFSPDGKVLASSLDETVQMWNLTTGTCNNILCGHLDSMVTLAFSPDGTALASASRNLTLRLWNSVMGE